tara:strand:- start:21539 stop:22528 length:990 start_codon:yes stop_codon:yes gene_type:complete
MMTRLSLLLFFVSAAASWIPAQTLELRTGEVVIGRVIDVDDHVVKIDVTFPAEGVRSVARADMEPRSVYAVLASRIDQADAKAHLELAHRCRELGLFALGIAEAREAARRNPAFATDVDKLVAEFRGRIAADIIQQAERDYADDRIGSARLAVHVVLRDYKDTTAAKRAGKLAKKIAARVGPAPREATPKEIKAAIAAVRRDLARTEKDTKSAAHGKMRNQRGLQRAIARLEKTWARIGNLIAPIEAPAKSTSTAAATIADRLSSAQADLRHRLTGAYLSLGSIYLQRRALPDADEWCNKACELDPENKHLHRLHEQIIQAKIVSGWGY